MRFGLVIDWKEQHLGHLPVKSQSMHSFLRLVDLRRSLVDFKSFKSGRRRPRFWDI
jgi:hypothetical protein